ncbi:hypothetical protein CDAR_550941 [Caerostris darwini]|uniref:Uncharacterized protein n=1 Tax=Caerostris darwini TaxID=1538125 RepID=A0AAV4QNZ2_9ARAC|nr:hypothetical protein CDAR_550941 [Caerostris darwini]
MTDKVMDTSNSQGEGLLQGLCREPNLMKVSDIPESYLNTNNGTERQRKICQKISDLNFVMVSILIKSHERSDDISLQVSGICKTKKGTQAVSSGHSVHSDHLYKLSMQYSSHLYYGSDQN